MSDHEFEDKTDAFASLAEAKGWKCGLCTEDITYT